MPAPRQASLALVAAALAERLPGMWTSEYHRHRTYADQFPTVERLWDLGHVDHIVSQYVLGHDAVLTGPDGEQLYHRPAQLPPPVRGGSAGTLGRHTPPDLRGARAERHRRPQPPGARRRSHHPASTAPLRDRRGRRPRQGLDQPEPPHRQPASEVARTLTLVWYPDGVVGAPYDSVPEEAYMTLFDRHFQYRPNESAVVLPASYSAGEQAVLVQLAAQRLMLKSIGVNFRRAVPLPPSAAASAATNRSPVAAAPKSASRR
ncbi:hypothetical protein [Streptomyces sp. NPDC047061]|uniref:hypothetical protein n=1 Tax=Streptomyces sp. NPDC047061 TaxID=3154605 RepID=UPI0033C724F9